MLTFLTALAHCRLNYENVNQIIIVIMNIYSRSQHSETCKAQSRFKFKRDVSFKVSFLLYLIFIGESSSEECVNGVLVFVFQVGQVEAVWDRTCHQNH